MLRKIRLTLAVLFFLAVTGLFLDFTGTLHAWLGWTAKIQFLPALLALNAGVVAFLVVLTLLVGRIYCSVVCPLGVMQDIVSWVSGRRKKKKYRFSYSPEKKWLRYGVLALFVVAMIAGVGSLVVLLAPYSSYGRIASNLFAPLWGWGNNVLAYFAERVDSYAFYETEVWLRSLPTFVIAVATFIIIGVLAWRNGRTYCNTICPVGTVLGFLSRFSLLRVTIDESKCNKCGLCSRKCKAACINGKEHKIDYSRCVACMDCIDTCRHGAIKFRLNHSRPSSPPSSLTPDPSPKERGVNTIVGDKQNKKNTGLLQEGKGDANKQSDNNDNKQPTNNSNTPDIGSDTNHSPLSWRGGGGEAVGRSAGEAVSRRTFLTTTVAVAATAALRAQEKKVDGGLAVIEDKKIPKRRTPIVPPGAQSLSNMARHCTACQLCVSVCPNGVLRPSAKLETLMQPEASYERGYCRPECTKCSEVCPAGAILKITAADKSAIQIGHAVWVKDNCVPVAEGLECGNCARHCPAGAILMVPSDAENPDSPKIPVVNTERCIGCGACENLCPARPFSAIYVEGHEHHRTI